MAYCWVGVPGVAPAKVVILGGGMAGHKRARTWRLGMQAQVTILDKSVDRLRMLAAEFNGRATLLSASSENIRKHVRDADLVIGAALVPGAHAPSSLIVGCCSKCIMVLFW